MVKKEKAMNDTREDFGELMPDIRELGYVRVAAAVPQVFINDVENNVKENVRLAVEADAQGVDILCLPELSLSAYTCKDLFEQDQLVEDCAKGLKLFCEQTADLNMISIVGLPWTDAVSGRLLNVAAVTFGGKVLAFIPKSYLPNYREFEEERWFLAALGLKFENADFYGDSVPLGTDILIFCPQLRCRFGVEICEDGWMIIPPSSLGIANGANLYFNLSASNELVGKDAYRREFVVNAQAARGSCGYIYVSAGQSESTSNTVFGGHCMISENGTLVAEKTPLTGDGTLLVTDIDVGKLKFEARVSNTRGRCCSYWSGLFPFRQVIINLKERD